MTNPVSGIFAPMGDRHSIELQRVVNQIQPESCVLLAFPDDRGEPSVSLSRDEVYWGDVDASQLKTGFVRAFQYSNPVVPQALTDVDWSLWHYTYIGEQQKTSFLYSALSEIDRRGVSLFNPPGMYLDVSMKVDLLERVRSGGVAVAEMVCTNDLNEARVFAQSREHILWRPVTGRAAWQLCLEKQMQALLDCQKPPVILAGIEPGLFLRCYVLNGEPVLCLKYVSPAQVPLERLEVFQTVPDSGFFDDLRACAKLAGLKWGAIHCAVEGERLAVYDIDADPVLTALPEEVRDYLNACIACTLLERDLPDYQSIPEGPLPRALPFLRRMLTALFEVERSKYTVIVDDEQQSVTSEQD